MKYKGTLVQLKTLITSQGVDGEWEEKSNSHQFRSNNGGILNYYSNGTINFQGKQDGKFELENIIMTISHDKESKVGEIISKNTSEGVSKVKVFVIYGHDDNAREQLELILHKLELDPFILSNTGGKGLTIIEALEEEMIIKEECKFGIVLLTPDDVGYSKKDGPEKAEPRARQNVVLEMGMIISSIGRHNVAILKKGHLEVPSDANGILYIPFNDHVKETVPRLVDRLNNSGIKLKPESISKASA